MRKTRSNVRMSHETTEVEHETSQREGFVDVDTIPSPHIKPESSRLVEEESQAPTMTAMKIDLHDSAQG